MLTTIMKLVIQNMKQSATSDALLQEIELQKRIEMWGEGRRLFDMKRLMKVWIGHMQLIIVRLLQRKSLQGSKIIHLSNPR